MQKIHKGIKHNVSITNAHLTFKVDVCAHAHPAVVCLWTGLLLYFLFRCGHWYQNSLWFRRPKNRSWIQQETEARTHWNLKTHTQTITTQLQYVYSFTNEEHHRHIHSTHRTHCKSLFDYTSHLEHPWFSQQTHTPDVQAVSRTNTVSEESSAWVQICRT